MDKIAVLIPCYNEAKTISKVVHDFREAVPEAKIYVYDNDPIVSVTDGYVECTIKPYGAYCGLAGLN